MKNYNTIKFKFLLKMKIMRKERSSLENNNKGNKIEKAIIKRINESALNNNIKKIDNYRNKKMHLYLNNDSNSYYSGRSHYKGLSSQNIYNHNLIQNEKYNNIFLENNSYLLKSNKTRNKNENLNQDKKHDYFTRKNTIEDISLKNIFLSNLNNKRKKNKANKEIMNMSHQSCDEEMSRKFYLNGNYKKIYLKRLNNIFPRNNSQIYEKNNLKYNNSIYCSSKNNSNNNSKQYFKSYNNGYLTTKEKSNCENTYSNINNNSNTINTTKNNDTPIITNFSGRNNKYTYKKVNLSLSNQQRKKYIIESYENKTINNNSSRNIQNFKGDNLLEKKRNGFKIYKKHYASKSQENINENSSKYNHLFNKKIISIMKQMDYYDFYKNKIKLIIQIQKWWKDMLFHMYIEKKIVLIQKFYRNYLKKRNNSIKIKLEYIYNLNKIILIQNYWKKYLKIRQNKLFDNNCENLLPKSIPFKLDNFDINDSTEPNIIIKNAEIIKNNNIYLKKNVYKIKSERIKNNTVSNFYEPKRNKLMVKQEIVLFIISNKKEELSPLELQRRINNIKINDLEKKDNNKFKFCKNISFEILNDTHKNINNIFHPPIKTNLFIEKEFKKNKETIHKKMIISPNNYYISKKRLNKKPIIKLILIQKILKKYLISKKIKYIKKSHLPIYYVNKIRKSMNLLNDSSHNKIENFSFKGSYLFANSNSHRDKTSEIDISNSKSEKTNSFNDKDRQKYNLNYINSLFSFENSGNKINNKDSFQTLLLKDKLKNIFNRYISFNLKLKMNAIFKVIRNIKFIISIKKYIINRNNNKIFNTFKYQLLNAKNKKNKNDIFDDDDIINIINRKRIIKNKPTSNFLIINQKKSNKKIFSPKEYYINDEEGLAKYILNYFYNEKKFTNININLIKERLSKSPLIYRTQSNIKNYIEDLHKDILENKICHNCFCKFEENCDIDCSCHKEVNHKINKQKGGISIYRQKINKIIKDNKRGVKTVQNNNEIENCNNLLLFNCLNKNDLENGFNEFNNINSTINRYDTDSINQ